MVILFPTKFVPSYVNLPSRYLKQGRSITNYDIFWSLQASDVISIFIEVQGKVEKNGFVLELLNFLNYKWHIIFYWIKFQIKNYLDNF